MSTFSDRLKILRGTTSQAEFARELDMQRMQYIRYEKGVTIPGIDILERICRINGCSADWLLGLPERGGVIVGKVKGDGNIVAQSITTAAPAVPVRSAGNAPLCKKCSYKRDAEAFYKISERRKK